VLAVHVGSVPAKCKQVTSKTTKKPKNVTVGEISEFCNLLLDQILTIWHNPPEMMSASSWTCSGLLFQVQLNTALSSWFPLFLHTTSAAIVKPRHARSRQSDCARSLLTHRSLKAILSLKVDRNFNKPISWARARRKISLLWWMAEHRISARKQKRWENKSSLRSLSPNKILGWGGRTWVDFISVQFQQNGRWKKTGEQALNRPRIRHLRGLEHIAKPVPEIMKRAE
jgi:hypothetical protein